MKYNKFLIFIVLIFAFAYIGCNRHSEHAESAHPEEEAAHGAEGHAGDPSEMHAGETEAEHRQVKASLISFSRNLQQEFGIQTQPVKTRPIHETIRCLGEIKAAGTRESEVVAPFAAMLLPDAERGLVKPGQRVKKGELLAILAPSAEEGGWHQLLGEYKLAKAEYERVQRLSQEGAVSSKRVVESQSDLTAKEARVRAAIGGLEIASLDSAEKLFHLRAPTDGILTDTHLRFGQHVEAGEHLFNIVDPSKVWLEAQVPASEAQALDGIKEAYFSISGSDALYRTNDYNGKLITIGGLLDPATRRIPVIIQIDNPENKFKPGSYAQIYLRREASHGGLSLPKSAIVDEDGISVAILQIGDEDFRKTVLTTGVHDGDFVEVLAGLSDGDRVVTNGAYKIKLAAAKTGGADAHAGHGH